MESISGSFFTEFENCSLFLTHMTHDTHIFLKSFYTNGRGNGSRFNEFSNVRPFKKRASNVIKCKTR